MRELGRLYYTLVGSGTCTITGTDPYTVNPDTWADANSGADGMFVVVGNTVGVIYDFNDLSSETFKYSPILAYDDLGHPTTGDTFYIIDDADYIEGLVDRAIVKEKAYYSDLYIQYNEKVTRTITFENYVKYKFVDNGSSTMGAIDSIEDLLSKSLYVYADCAGNFAYKAVHNSSATGIVKNRTYRPTFNLRLIG